MSVTTTVPDTFPRSTIALRRLTSVFGMGARVFPHDTVLKGSALAFCLAMPAHRR